MEVRQQAIGSVRVGAIGTMAAIDLADTAEWLYVYDGADGVRIGNGRACGKCSYAARGLVRCDDHKACRIIAMQYRLHGL